MCGRFTLHTPRDCIRAALAVERDSAVPEQAFNRYNIAPSQTVAAVRASPVDGVRELVALHWGLIPSWAKEAQSGYQMINARAETVAEKPAFRTAFRSRRCLIPADGFFEWQSLPGERAKQPWYMSRSDGQPFAFAGLWECWEPRDGNGQPIESCTIIVTSANELVSSIHDRMPVILDPGDYQLWLDPANRDSQVLSGLLRPYPAQSMAARPVSRRVNSPSNDSSDCIEPIAPTPEGDG